MRNFKINALALFFAGTIFACQQAPTAPAAPAVSEVKITSQKLEKSEGKEPEKAFNFKVSYPVVSGGGADLAKNVATWVENCIFSLTSPEADAAAAPTSLEKSLEKFMAAWKENAAGGGLNAAYTLESTDTVLHNSPKCLALRLDTYIFTAGAHGTPVTNIENFDPATGQKIMSSQVIKDQKALLPLIEKKYLALKGEGFGGEYLTESGKIEFPQNWGYTDSGILFHYNAYEIAAYAVGDADIFLTWEEMGAAAAKL